MSKQKQTFKEALDKMKSELATQRTEFEKSLPTEFDDAQKALVLKTWDASKQVSMDAFNEILDPETFKSEVEAITSEAITELKLKSKEDMDAFKEKLNDVVTKIQTTISKSGLKSINTETGYKSIKQQLVEAITSSKSQYEAFKNKEVGSFSFDLDMKAAGLMLTTTNLTSNNYITSTTIERGLTDIMGVEPSIRNYTNRGNTNSSRIVFFEKVNRDGTTVFIAEGTTKNKIDFDVKEGLSYARKVADYIEVSEEMIDDIEFMASEIENELRYQVELKADTETLLGDGLGSNLKGISKYALPYNVATGVLTTTPTTYDVLVAAATQIRKNNGRATKAFLNPTDYANSGIQKGTTGYYIFQDGKMISLPFDVIDDNNIPAGKMLVGDMRKSIVRDYKTFSIQMAYKNDDFIKNLITIRGELRMHHYIKDNHKALFVYDTISTVKTAITAP